MEGGNEMEVMINNSWGNQAINNGIPLGTGFPESAEKKFEIAGKENSSNNDAYTKGIMHIDDVKNLLYMMIGLDVKIESPKGALGGTIDSVA
jgi:hypothetical protein